jgi:hypothetical protein
MNGISAPKQGMTIDLNTHRQTLLRAVHAICKAQPAAQIHLIYTPELQDPLNLVGDTRRDVAFIHAPTRLKVIAPDREKAPRVVPLDCRRVAACLLEGDPGLDDPEFEHSIKQSHIEICLDQPHDAELSNDEREFSEYAIGGWLIGTESAKTLSVRLRNFSNQQRSWIRWTNPSVLSALWPTMTHEQRFTLLGDATWLAFDITGTLRHYAGNGGVATASADQAAAPRPFIPGLDQQQIQMLKNVPLVRDLIRSWKAMLEEQEKKLPANAEQLLHVHVRRAQQVGLAAESVAICTMVAVQLKPGATDDAEWIKLVRHAAADGLDLRDLLDTLSDVFWDRYGLFDYEGDV